MKKYILEKYILLIADFVHNVIPVQKFESYYLDIFQYEPHSLAMGEINNIINELFYDLDSYCGDPAIADYDSPFPYGNIDEHELRKRAADALEQLIALRTTL